MFNNLIFISIDGDNPDMLPSMRDSAEFCQRVATM
jgi:hypothetical protein